MYKTIMSFFRKFLFILIALIIWAIWSLGPLLNNNPADFQAAGSIIVAWAIVFYGRERVSREKIRGIYQSNALFSSIKYLETRQQMHEKIAENTANRDALCHFRLLETLGLKDTAVPDQLLAIRELEMLAKDDTENEKLYRDFRSAQERSHAYRNEWNEHEERHEPWLRVIARLETVAVVFGTLQWGYGDRWVKMIHDTTIPLSAGWLN